MDSASQNKHFNNCLHKSAESAVTAPDSAGTVPDSAVTAPYSAGTGPDSAVTAPESAVSSGFHDFELTNAADSAILPYRQLKSQEIIHCGISP